MPIISALERIKQEDGFAYTPLKKNLFSLFGIKNARKGSRENPKPTLLVKIILLNLDSNQSLGVFWTHLPSSTWWLQGVGAA